MSLIELYAKQYQWRRWSSIYDQLGELTGASLLDLGCGIGDHTRDLAQRGAKVTAIDANPELIDYASHRNIPGATFVCDNIKNLTDLSPIADGVWASFLPAYFPDFNEFLRLIEPSIKPGAWLAAIELDDIFGHAPLDDRWVRLAESYYSKSLEQGLYRFRSLEHVKSALIQNGWRIEVQRTIEDDEFGFSGSALPDVFDAWQSRLDLMMPRFIERFGNDASPFGSAFLNCLKSPAHHSNSIVWFILAKSPTSSGLNERQPLQT